MSETVEFGGRWVALHKMRFTLTDSRNRLVISEKRNGLDVEVTLGELQETPPDE